MSYSIIKKSLIDYVRKGFLSIIIIGLFLNLILKDYIWPLSGIYYLLPLHILLALSIIYSFISIGNKLHRNLSILFIALILFILTFTDSGFIESKESAKLISWNIARDRTTSEEVAEFVNKHKAEIFIFIEFDKKSIKNAKKLDLNKLIPEYKIHRLSGNMAILVRDEFSFTRFDSLTDRYNYFNIVKANGIRYAVVDVGSWPLYNRAKPFDMLFDLVTEYKVDIIAGDFNTPYATIHFEKFLENYNCGKSEKPYGRTTWPSYFPFVSLDHILVSKKYKITKYQPEKICVSDHYPLLLSYEKK